LCVLRLLLLLLLRVVVVVVVLLLLPLLHLRLKAKRCGRRAAERRRDGAAADGAAPRYPN
jgi:uncharacterized membrane protein YqiK